jgi:uncharacterized membrane protein YeiH
VAIIMGCITGAAGGVLRDLLLNRTPVSSKKKYMPWQASQADYFIGY